MNIINEKSVTEMFQNVMGRKQRGKEEKNKTNSNMIKIEVKKVGRKRSN